MLIASVTHSLRLTNPVRYFATKFSRHSLQEVCDVVFGGVLNRVPNPTGHAIRTCRSPIARECEEGPVKNKQCDVFSESENNWMSTTNSLVSLPEDVVALCRSMILRILLYGI